MKITCKRGIKASKGSIDQMIDAFQNRILQLQDDEVNSSTDIDACDYQDDMPVEECDNIPVEECDSVPVESSLDINNVETDVLQKLQEAGYDISSPQARAEAKAAADYIIQMNDKGEIYSVDDWYDDTCDNYPEDLEDIPMI